MPWGLKRYYGTGALHFITCSCYKRLPYLGTPERRNLLLTVTEAMRQRYQFAVVGYVVMPEHMHLLISEPQTGTPSTVMQAIKLSFSKRVLKARVPHFSRAVCARSGAFPSDETGDSHHLWTRRFYDFNLWSQPKESEKLHYMHQNPVVRGLVQSPEQWPWSSYRFYAYGEQNVIRTNEWALWEKKIRSKAS